MASFTLGPVVAREPRLGGSPRRRHRDHREGEDTRPGRMAIDDPKQDGEDGSGCCQGEAEGVSTGEMRGVWRAGLNGCVKGYGTQFVG
ncbi:hypothetical protein EYF80_040063 [Liparis tanakae]|uniref:Uncharacterized protein n=1 Tax=Liparis tanakae TaxID=230148 RepID=A0A4Z2GA92_9TELE|nr:hypothetical protein EYF80_040063 [Liparis tanakae]